MRLSSGNVSRNIAWFSSSSSSSFISLFLLLILVVVILLCQPSSGLIVSSPKFSGVRLSFKQVSSIISQHQQHNSLRMSNENESEQQEERVVLLVGSCGLDRLLTVTKYPNPDAKVRTTAYHEMGGGNAPNTASAMGLLNDATFFKDKNIKLKFISKVGADTVGQQLMEELEKVNVDTTSPLMKRGPVGSTTSFTSIIVSEEEHTRTCIHTPGTCGELTMDDVGSVDMDEVFENVIHLHSDARHTRVALFLAGEARRRRITVSCDSEKDRNTKDLDELMKVSDILFTNSNYLGPYLQRLESELEAARDESRRKSLPNPATTAGEEISKNFDTIETITKSLTPSAFYSRWYSQMKKQVIVTQGSKGSLHFRPISRSHEASKAEDASNNIEISTAKTKATRESSSSLLHLTHQCDDTSVQWKTEYIVHREGVLDDLNIVDTTGAGDAFIGGYLMAMISCHTKKENVDTDRGNEINDENEDSTAFALAMGSYVGGRKLEGPGARSALPTGTVVDSELGITRDEMMTKLRTKLSSFNQKIN